MIKILILFLFLYSCKDIKHDIPKAPCHNYGFYLGQDLTDKVITDIKTKYKIPPKYIMTFIGWSDFPFNHNLSDLIKIDKIGIPIITLEPWLYPSKKGISLEDIVEGKEDNVIKEFSNFLNKIPSKIIYLRFAHEMNGNWYPWSGVKNNKNTNLYKNAYIKIYNLISQNTSKKIIWIWSINANNLPNSSWNRAINYYPGDKYVDIIGLDGYNWSANTWNIFRRKSFNKIFKKQIEEVKNFNKPIHITEMASAGFGKNKAKWIEDFFKQIKTNYNFIHAFVWFNIDKEKTWSIINDKESSKIFEKELNFLNICTKD
jgi:beta-mannanase